MSEIVQLVSNAREGTRPVDLLFVMQSFRNERIKLFDLYINFVYLILFKIRFVWSSVLLNFHRTFFYKNKYKNKYYSKCQRLFFKDKEK